MEYICPGFICIALRATLRGVSLVITMGRVRPIAVTVALFMALWAPPAAAAAVSGRAELLASSTAQPDIATKDCGGGVTLVSRTPKPGFDPTVASVVALDENGFPPKPQDPQELSVWLKYVRSAIPATLDCSVTNGHPESDPAKMHGRKPDALGGIGHQGVASFNWAGWNAYNANFVGADAAVRVPSIGNAGGNHIVTESSHWVGTVQDPASQSVQHPLIQTGFDANWNGFGVSYAAWCEVWSGTEDWQTGMGLAMSAGDYIYQHATWVGGGVVDCRLINQTTGSAPVEVQHSDSRILGTGQAVWVTEKLGTYPLAYYNTVLFTSAHAYQSGVGARNLYGLTTLNYYMRNNANTTTMATVSSVNTNSGFTSTWLAAGP